MEGVTLEEFVGWFFSSGTFVVVILAAVAWKAAQSAWDNNRRMKRRWLEQGHDDKGQQPPHEAAVAGAGSRRQGPAGGAQVSSPAEVLALKRKESPLPKEGALSLSSAVPSVTWVRQRSVAAEISLLYLAQLKVGDRPSRDGGRDSRSDGPADMEIGHRGSRGDGGTGQRGDRLERAEDVEDDLH